MKRILLLICTAAILLTGILVPAGVFADGDHPIKLTITCDPVPELEGDGTIPTLLFTIRNESESNYILENAKLSGGYENQEMELEEPRIEILAGASKEFELNNVAVSSDQLDVEIFYTLSWDETETIVDEETGDATFLTHKREAIASMMIERFIVPELSVFAMCSDDRVRTDTPFTVEYTIKNDTEFDMTGLKLFDPEQSMQSIELETNEISAGQMITVPVEYRMGTMDMTFKPRLEYISRSREMEATSENVLTVESVVVDLKLSVQPYPATSEGTEFVVTVKNAGNKTLTNIRLFDEINTPLDGAFDLAADQVKTVHYFVKPAVSADTVRTVRFHATAVDAFGETLTVEDPNDYEVLPYVASDAVRISLSAVLQSPYYDENGKLCASIQFHIRNSGEMKMHNAVLYELTLFGKVIEYEELRNGDRYYTQTYQLDGIRELRFRLDAVDPAGQPCSTETVVLDLSSLKDFTDKKPDRIIVETDNPYLRDLDEKYTGVVRTVSFIGLIIAGILGIICIALYIVEVRIKRRLPAEFEEDLERAMRSTKRRTEKQLFSDSPTERFGYTAPIKLRNYGELTEEEARERREAYQRGLRESLRREGLNAAQEPKPAPTRSDRDGTRVLPVTKPNAPEKPAQGATGQFRKPSQEQTTVRTDLRHAQPGPERTGRPAQPATGRFDRPATGASAQTQPKPEGKPDSAKIEAIDRTALQKKHPERPTVPKPEPVRPRYETKGAGTPAAQQQTVRHEIPKTGRPAEAKPDPGTFVFCRPSAPVITPPAAAAVPPAAAEQMPSPRGFRAPDAATETFSAALLLPSPFNSTSIASLS